MLTSVGCKSSRRSETGKREAGIAMSQGPKGRKRAATKKSPKVEGAATSTSSAAGFSESCKLLFDTETAEEV